MKSLLCLVPPAATIALSVCFLYFNPYSDAPPNLSTQRIVWGLLVAPALLVIASVFLRHALLKHLGFLLSIPVGFYLSLASIPSYWNLFMLFILCYPFLPIGSFGRPVRGSLPNEKK